MYHRVAPQDVDPWSLCVTPEHFEAHLQALGKHATPISLQELAQVHQQGEIPHRAVVVTFDDGYANNLHHAKPLLEKYNIPATVFVTTGYLDQQREFWWDELEQALLQPGELPQQLCLTINGKEHQWELGTAANYTQADYHQDYQRQAWQAPTGSRLNFYYSLWQQLQPLETSRRLPLVDEILDWADAEPKARPTHRCLSSAELRTLEQGEVVEIGAHSVTHPSLAEQTVAQQKAEIQRSKDHLEKVLAHSVNSFAYPFGNYTAQTVDLIREMGFTCACSTVPETVWQQNDKFLLPRFEVHDWSGKEFTQKLWRWLL